MAWLLAQLQTPPWADDRVNWKFALVPVVLSAAEEVELARCDEATIQCALHAWDLLPMESPAKAAKTANLLLTSWENAQAQPGCVREFVLGLRDKLSEFTIRPGEAT